MNEEQIEQKFREIIAEVGLGDATRFGSLTLETTFESLNLDELDRVEIEIACEEEFAITFADDECMNCTTLGDMFDIIKTKLKAKA